MFLGRSAGSQSTNISAETARVIDEEVRRIIDESYDTAKRLLEENRDKLDVMAEALMKYETIDLEQINDIMSGKPVRDPKGWTDDDRRGPGAAAPSVGDAPDAGDESRDDGIIGGPAGEH